MGGRRREGGRWVVRRVWMYLQEFESVMGGFFGRCSVLSVVVVVQGECMA